MKIFALLFVLMAVMAAFACSGLQLQDKEPWVKVAIHAAASNLGYWVATEQPQLNDAIRAGYLAIRSGQVPPEELAKALAEIKAQKPLLALNIANVLRAMGAVFESTGIITDNIPVAYWDEAEIGYRTGRAMGMQEMEEMDNG